MADKWRDLGVKLLEPSLIDRRVLEVIAADHPHSVEGCCKNMFEKWLTTQVDPSWNQLIEALKSIGLNYIASQIEESLQGMIKYPYRILKQYYRASNLIYVLFTA